MLCQCVDVGIIPKRPFQKRPCPKTAVRRPIREFVGMEWFWLLVYARPFWDTAVLRTAILARNPNDRLSMEATWEGRSHGFLSELLSRSDGALAGYYSLHCMRVVLIVYKGLEVGETIDSNKRCKLNLDAPISRVASNWIISCIFLCRIHIQND